jgi:tetratricopeptide (TPR) repeat protein
MGECLLHLGRSADARRALDEASKQEPSACGVWALLSMAALDSGDMAGARQTLETALSRKPSSSQEVMRVARAAMRLGSWAKALAAIETPPSDQEDPALLLEAARLRVRLADAHWLFADAAHATAHAPEASLATSEARHTLASLLDRYTASGGTVAVSDGIRLRAAAAFDEASAGLLSSLKPIAAQDASGETKEGMAIALLRAGRLSEAVEVLEQPAVTHTADEWTALLFGLCHAEMGQGEIARQAYAAASANPAIKPLADYLAARTLLAEDNPSEFLTRAGRALLVWDEEPYWHYEIANVYAQQGDQDAALGHLQRAVELAPEEGDYQLALARGYREAGDLEQAKAAYAQVLNGMPAVGSIWKEAGFLAMAAGDVVAAHSWLERAAALLASDPDCLVGMASAASKSGHEREANEHIQAAFRVAPENPAVLLALGEIMAEQGKFEKAIQAYDRAIHRAADPSAARLARSRLLIRVGRPAQAVAEAKAVVEAHPEADHGWAALAEAYEATGELQSAVPAAEQAVKLSPRGASYRLILGRVCRRAGHLDRALDELASAQAAHPRDARLALELGQVYEERRDFKRSLDEYVRAIELDPTSTQAHYRGGLMLKNMKAYTQAGQLLKRAVELNPKDPEALHQLAAVRALELVHGGIPLQAVTS